ncbi:unnamed protein product [Bubo scandiacus]
MYLLTAMSLERCLSVLFPIWYRCHHPKHLSGITCGVLWALAGLFVSLRRHPGKLYVAVLLSVIFLFLFGFPFSVVVFLDPIYLNLFNLHISYLLASMNSSINPVIYFLVGSCRQRRFQGSMKVALRRVFKEKVVSEEETHVPEDTAVQTPL